MNITAGVTVSRNSSDEIHIVIQDRLSGVSFVNVNMTLADFALALTGFSQVEAAAEVSGLNNVGKVRVTESRSVVYTGGSDYDKNAQQKWLIENCQEEGWILNAYLGRQSSVTRQGGTTTLNYSVTKFVDPQEDL